MTVSDMKAKLEELIGMVYKVTRAVKDSLPSIIDQYQEAAEKVGAKAKAELDAYATGVINRLGVKALAALNAADDGQPPHASLT